ncbi:MAG: TerC family protein [Cytophagaceae bacterium]|nr:TerC family protein [Cytophagaceae bacterium]
MTIENILWIVFVGVVLVMMALDLGVFHKKVHVVKVKEALIWSGIWIILSLLFNLVIYLYLGKEAGLQFLTGYIVEKSLSVDNIFVFFLLFSYFNLTAQYQHKVLFWGVIGAILLRLLFIFIGASVIKEFHWVMYIMSILLVFTGIKMLFRKQEEMHPEGMFVIKLLKKILPVYDKYADDKFFISIKGKDYATLLFIALVSVEFTDVVFAIDSIPAIFSISKDPFIIFTSNIFAIMGLRSLYFALSGVIGKFRFLNAGLSVILVFIGVKMFLHDIYHIPTSVSLIVIATTLTLTIISSFLFPEQKKETSPNVGKNQLFK